MAFRLARNLLIDEFRKQQKFVELEDNQLFAESQDASYHYDYEAFDKALMALSFVQREALTLQQEGFSLEELLQSHKVTQRPLKLGCDMPVKT